MAYKQFSFGYPYSESIAHAVRETADTQKAHTQLTQNV